jgi:hypothetical protein
MANHHEPFKVLGPIDWNDVPQDGLTNFLQDIFFEAQTVVDSIPSTESSNNSGSAGRARAKTDSAVLASITPTSSAHVGSQSKPAENLGVRHPTPASVAQAEKLQKEWKEVKINQKENPLNVQVHKLAAKDGKGAWFARRSLHDGLSFEQWRDALQKEFLESMKVQGQPGSGSIRGIGADKRVEDHTVQNTGHVQGLLYNHSLHGDIGLTRHLNSFPALSPVPWPNITQGLHYPPSHSRDSSSRPDSGIISSAAQTVHYRV